MAPTPDAIEPVNDEDSRPLGHDDPGADDAEGRGYLETEWLASGVAAGAPYATRVLIRRPRDPAAFSGTVVVEPMHWAGGRPAWRASRRLLIREGHAWAEVASQASAGRILAEHDPGRYARVRLAEGVPGAAAARARIGLAGAGGRDLAAIRRESDAFREAWRRSSAQSPEILAHAATALRGGGFGLPGVRLVLLAGLSQSGGVVRDFASEHHVRLSGAGPVFDGYLPMSSGGAAVPDLPVPVFELLGESELEQVRAEHLLPGQARGLSHRRADSPVFRLWEAAGMGHVDSRDDPVAVSAASLPAPARWSRYPHSHIVHAALASLVRWASRGDAPPPGRTIDTDGNGRPIRDADGHATGGVRSVHLDVPNAGVRAIAGPGPEWSWGSETPFGRSELRRRYGSGPQYRRRADARLAQLVDSGHCLGEDAEEYARRLGCVS